MHNPPGGIDDVYIEVVNDDVSPYDFVITTIQSAFGKSIDEARDLTNTIHHKGSVRIGPYAPPVAQAMLEVARRRAREAGFPLVTRLSDAGASANAIACSFCGKAQAECKHIYQGRGAYICDACAINSAKALYLETPSSVMRNICELLDWHFGGVPEADVVAVERTFPARMRADLQRALDEVLKRDDLRVVGIHGGNSYDALTFATLLGEADAERAGDELQQYQERFDFADVVSGPHHDPLN